MGARQKLNRAFFNGSLAVAVLCGLATESWLVSVLIFGGLLAANLLFHDIRPRGLQRGRDEHHG